MQDFCCLSDTRFQKEVALGGPNLSLPRFSPHMTDRYICICDRAYPSSVINCTATFTELMRGIIQRRVTQALRYLHQNAWQANKSHLMTRCWLCSLDQGPIDKIKFDFRCTCGGCGAPKFICYAGKRQWMELLNTGKKGKEKISKIEQGRQVLRPQVPLEQRLALYVHASACKACSAPSSSGPVTQLCWLRRVGDTHSNFNAVAYAERLPDFQLASTLHDSMRFADGRSTCQSSLSCFLQSSPCMQQTQYRQSTFQTQRCLRNIQGWPLPSSTEVWVLPSTSGAAAMTVEERVGPYRDMAARLAAVPWPLSRAKCQSVQTECLKLKDS